MGVAVEMLGVSKRFGTVEANREVDFALERGEVHALLGENGAGKTTLMNVLYGLLRPDAGAVRVDGRRVAFRSPRDAIAAGIGMVHQHFMLVPTLTVAENIALGMPSGGRLRLDLEAVAERIRGLGEQFGLPVDPRAEVQALAVGVRQRVEIVKALSRGARILILDEPTAVLAPQEAAELFRVLRRLTLEGASVVFITHKLDEVMAVADRVTVLRDGRRVATLRIGETSPPSLARLMVGREVLSRVERPAAAPGPVRLALRGVSAGEAGPWPALRRISLEVRAGEIFGVAGVAGNGQTELAQVITGLLPAREGRIEIDGTDITRLPPRTRFAYGLAHIPEDRRQAGLVGEMTVRANAMLGHHRRRPFSNGWVFSREADACVEQMLRDYAIAVPSAQVKARHLSGGNQQRLILARELFQRPRLMVTVQPTWGLDVAATEYVHRQLVAQRAAGAAILLISTELAELLALSDRLGVMHAGELVATGAPASFTLEEIGLCMAGARR